MRKLKYRLTDEQFDRIVKANTPIPLIMLQYGMPRTVQERVNAIWRELGIEIGFDPDTVEPDGDMQKDFLAVPTDQRNGEGEERCKTLTRR